MKRESDEIEDLFASARAAFERGAHSEAEMQICLAVRKAEALKSDDTCWIGICLRELGLAYAKRREYKLASKQYELAIEAFDKKFGPDNIGTATCLLQSATLTRIPTNYKDSESQVRRAISILTKASDEVLEGTDFAQNLLALKLDAQFVLALNLMHQHRFHESEVCYRLAVSITEGSVGLEHMREGLIAGLKGLAKIILVKAGTSKKVDDAIVLFEHGIQILESIPQPGHYEILDALEALAQNFALLERYEESALARNRALSYAEQQFGADSPKLVGPMKLLAESYELSRNYADATVIRHRVLDIHERELEQTHPDLGGALVELAISYDLEGKPREADPFFARYFEITPVDEIERFIYALERAGATMADISGYRALDIASWLRRRLDARLADRASLNCTE